VNQPPIFVWHSPIDLQVVSSGKPITIAVSAYDPEGEPVTYSWKRDGLVAKTGPDSSFTTIFIGPHGEPHSIICIASDPEGIQDSVRFVFTITDVEEHFSPMSIEFLLDQNYPNPFNPSTSIGYQLPRSANVTLTVFNSLGEHVTTLVNESKQAGHYTVQWNPVVASGIYLYRLQIGEFVETKRMILLK
jgi:hypothetical protein